MLFVLITGTAFWWVWTHSSLNAVFNLFFLLLLFLKVSSWFFVIFFSNHQHDHTSYIIAIQFNHRHDPLQFSSLLYYDLNWLNILKETLKEKRYSKSKCIKMYNILKADTSWEKLSIKKNDIIVYVLCRRNTRENRTYMIFVAWHTRLSTHVSCLTAP